MKKALLIIFSMCIAGCGASKPSKNWHLAADCPQGYTCLLDIHPDTKLVIKHDDFGKPYYAEADSTGVAVVTYKLTRESAPGIADGNYEEKIVFETNGKDLNSMTPENTKLLYGVHCFCKGKAGYYKADKAEMVYTDGRLTINLPDIVEGQLLKEVIIDVK